MEKNESHLECTLSDTDLFTPSFIQSDIQHGFYEDIFPISQLDDSGPIEFSVENAMDKFIDAANTYLKIKIKIIKADGSNIAADENVGPINYLIGSLFSQVDVKLGGCTISSSSNTYSYRAIFETLLNFGPDAKQSQLQMGLYCKDVAEQLDSTNTENNTGLGERMKYFAESKVVEICGRIYHDIFNQGRLIVNSLPLRITLHRNKSDFVLMSGTENPQYKIVITESVLCVRKVQLTPHKFMEIQQNLDKEPIKYPLNRADVRMHSVAAGLTSLNWDNAFQGQLPNRVFIGMVDNVSYTGRYNRNPFNFKHFSVSKLGVFINGESLPTQPMKFNFEQDHYLEGYQSLFTTTGKSGRDEGIDINRRDYKNGYALLGFDVSPATCHGGHQEIVKRGALRVEIEFAMPLPNTITVLLYADFDNILTVDKARNMLKNY